MSKYVVELNERSKFGKLIMELLNELGKSEQINVRSLEDFEKREDEIVAKEIRRGNKSKLLSFEQTRSEISRLKKQLVK